MKENLNNLINQTKMITQRIMGKINWNKIRRPEFEKDEKGRIWATLTISLWKKICYIQFLVSEEYKQELEKKDCWGIIESFIHQQLVNRGRNGYFYDNCPECEQPTLTKLPIANSYREAIACAFCNWAGSLKKYLDYK